jgi:hypothetical protein
MNEILESKKAVILKPKKHDKLSGKTDNLK